MELDDSSSKPTLLDINLKYDVAHAITDSWRREAKHDIDAFNGQMEPPVQIAKYVPIKPTTYRDRILAVRDQVLTNEPKVRIARPITHMRKDASEEAKGETDLGEAAAQAAFQMATASSTTNVIGAAVLDASITGLGAFRVIYDASRRPKPPEGMKIGSRKYLEWAKGQDFPTPVLIEAVDSTTIWTYETEEPEWVIVEIKRKGAEIKARYPKWSPKDADREGKWLLKDYEFREYRDSHYYAYATKNELLKVGEHFAGHHGFFFFSSGRGRDTGPWDERFIGFATRARQGKLFLREARNVCQVDLYNAAFAWPVVFYRDRIVDDEEPDFTPGATNRVPDNADPAADLYFARPPSAPDGLYKEREVILQDISQAVLDDRLSSANIPGNVAANTIRTLQEGAKRVSLLRLNTERALAGVMKHLLSILRNEVLFAADESLPLQLRLDSGAVRLLKIRSKDLPKNPAVLVSIDPLSEQDRAVRKQIGIQLAPFLDEEQLLDEYIGVQNPKLTIIKRDRDKVKNDLLQSGILRDYLLELISETVDPTTPPSLWYKQKQLMEQGLLPQEAAGPPVEGAPPPSAGLDLARLVGTDGITGYLPPTEPGSARDQLQQIRSAANPPIPTG